MTDGAFRTRNRTRKKAKINKPQNKAEIQKNYPNFTEYHFKQQGVIAMSESTGMIPIGSPDIICDKNR